MFDRHGETVSLTAEEIRISRVFVQIRDDGRRDRQEFFCRLDSGLSEFIDRLILSLFDQSLEQQIAFKVFPPVAHVFQPHAGQRPLLAGV